MPTRVPGAGGRASTAGATSHAVWDDQHRVVEHVALTPWTMPDPQSLDQVVAFAPQAVWCLVACGDGKRHAVARRAAAGGSVLRRLTHHTTLVDAATAR